MIISSSHVPSSRRKHRKGRLSGPESEKAVHSVRKDQEENDLKRRNKNAPSVMSSNRAVKRFRKNPGLSTSFRPHDPR